MCEWGTETTLHLKTIAELSHTGKEYWRDWPVDSCIAPIVRALNEGMVFTTQSCCGHGKGPGRIDLEDGRVLIIYADEKAIP